MAIDTIKSSALDTNIAVTGTLTSGSALQATGELKANGGVVINEDSLDVDFRVESNNNANMLVVDGGNDRVGIGEPTPSSFLHLKKSDATTYDATAADGQVGIGPTIYLENPANSNITVGGQIVFGMRETEAQSRIGATGGASPELTFGTGDVERMRIDSSGNLLVGKTADNVATVGIEARAAGPLISTRHNADALRLNRLNSDGEIIQLRKDGSIVGSIGNDNTTDLVITATDDIFFNVSGASNNILQLFGGSSANSQVKFDSPIHPLTDNTRDIGNSTERWKDLYLSGGAYIGGTGSANHLDDYEEGTYTPVLAATGCTFSYSVQLGSYVKIGNLVYLQFNITLSNRTGNLTNTVFIDNIPFLTKNVDNSLYSGGHIGHYFNINLGSGSSIAYQIPAVSTNQIELKEIGDNVGENSIVASELGTNAIIRGSIVYRAVT